MPTVSSGFPLTLHDALPIFIHSLDISISIALMSIDDINRTPIPFLHVDLAQAVLVITANDQLAIDRKSTRLNSSHVKTSYGVFCLKKKKYPSTSLYPVHWI